MEHALLGGVATLYPSWRDVPIGRNAAPPEGEPHLGKLAATGLGQGSAGVASLSFTSCHSVPATAKGRHEPTCSHLAGEIQIGLLPSEARVSEAPAAEQLGMKKPVGPASDDCCG